MCEIRARRAGKATSQKKKIPIKRRRPGDGWQIAVLNRPKEDARFETRQATHWD